LVDEPLFELKNLMISKGGARLSFLLDLTRSIVEQVEVIRGGVWREQMSLLVTLAQLEVALTEQMYSRE